MNIGDKVKTDLGIGMITSIQGEQAQVIFSLRLDRRGNPLRKVETKFGDGGKLIDEKIYFITDVDDLIPAVKEHVTSRIFTYNLSDITPVL